MREPDTEVKNSHLFMYVFLCNVLQAPNIKYPLLPIGKCSVVVAADFLKPALNQLCNLLSACGVHTSTDLGAS